MRQIIFKVIGYIFLRFFAFLSILSIFDKNVKWVRWSDLRSREDWFMFLWLFLIPPVVEGIVLGLPFSYGLTKIEGAKNKLPIYILFLVLFFIEFAINYWLLGVRYPFIKVAVSLVLFLILFRKRLL